MNIKALVIISDRAYIQIQAVCAGGVMRLLQSLKYKDLQYLPFLIPRGETVILVWLVSSENKEQNKHNFYHRIED